MISTRRRVIAIGSTALAGGLAGAPFLVRRVRSAEQPMRLANNLPPSHPLNVRLKEAVDAIRTETDGRVDIEIFPASQLGGDTDMLRQLRLGALQFFTLSGLILSTVVPAAAINGIGFAFTDYGKVWQAMDGDLGAFVRRRIAEAGLVPLERIWDNGFRQITSSSRPIRTPLDLVDFKIRVPVSPLWTSMFRGFGASPATINFAEVYLALQTGVVDGQENPLAIVDTAKLYEVQTFCSLTSHMWDGFWLLCNQQALLGLPDAQRESVERNFNAAALKQRADLVTMNGHVRTDLERRGMVFNEPDPAPFRARLQEAGFYTEWKEAFGDEAWSLLETTTGPLA